MHHGAIVHDRGDSRHGQAFGSVQRFDVREGCRPCTSWSGCPPWLSDVNVTVIVPVAGEVRPAGTGYENCVGLVTVVRADSEL